MNKTLDELKIVVVIPCYKVENHIEEVIGTLPDFISGIVCVNDCSPDSSGNLLDSIAQRDSRVTVVHHEKNKGVGGAMLTGYAKARELGADILVKMDGDGQMDPAHMRELIEPILAGRADFSKGNRFRDFTALREMPLSRRIGNLGLTFLIKAASGYWNMFDPTNGYTAIRGETMDKLPTKRIHNTYFFETSLIMELYYMNAVIEDVPIPARYGDEVSGLSRTRTLFEFPPKLLFGFFRRLILKYYLIDFNMGSVYWLFGIPLFVAGCWMGLVNFFKYASSGVGAPTGTVVIPALLIILGFQLILAALSVDLENYPRKR